MSTHDANKALVLRTVETIFNSRDLDRIGEFFAEGIVDHSLPPGTPQGIASKKALVGALLTAFPDLKIILG